MARQIVINFILESERFSDIHRIRNFGEDSEIVPDSPAPRAALSAVRGGRGSVVAAGDYATKSYTHRDRVIDRGGSYSVPFC
jgi:hypothetical protein